MKAAFFVIAMLLGSLPPGSCQTLATSADMDNRVQSLIGKMLNKKKEHQAFADLEAIGCPAVPSIVRLMDDSRDLPDPHISLTNKAVDAFEGKRHYGPKKVVDALAAILNQITGQDFGFIYNGASDAERTKAVRGWRDFLARTPKEKLCIGG